MASGASFSAPMVSAEVALVISMYYPARQSVRPYIDRAVPIDARNPKYAKMLGFGRVDLPTALLATR
jgi:hypothetical protein